MAWVIELLGLRHRQNCAIASVFGSYLMAQTFLSSSVTGVDCNRRQVGASSDTHDGW